MAPEIQAIFAAFVLALVAVYVTAGGMLARAVGRRLRGKKVTLGRGFLWFRGIVWALSAIGILCIVYGFCVEPYWLSTTRVLLTSPKLAHATRPVRIVQLSDLHCDPKVRLEDEIPLKVAALEPDVIVFTGDAANSADGVANFKQCMTRLARIAPTYAVRGNWDADGVDLFGGTGVHELEQEAVKISVAGTHFWLAGMRAYKVDEAARARLLRTLAAIGPAEYVVFLAHYPDMIDYAAERHVDLLLTGHTHGGQVALPFYGALITLTRHGKQYEAGLYKVDQTFLYVNRGIGMEGGDRVPRVRFCARPELTLFELGAASPGENPATASAPVAGRRGSARP
jgi:predicted MPP superfamily phosphohydrolase